MLKFGFRIKTKAGATVENLAIQAADLARAESRLLQMYPHATILSTTLLEDVSRGEGLDLESAISMIIKSD